MLRQSRPTNKDGVAMKIVQKAYQRKHQDAYIRNAK